MPTEEIEKLTFNRFIMTIGNLPSSYVESLSYYECMLWLCDYLQNTVIPAVNNNGEVVEELQGLYVELKNYVDSYFENLDVQQEINNKLDSMVEDGTLATLIGNYIDPLIEAQNNRIDIIDNKVDSVASGSPLVASSTSGMTDTTRTYVNTSDGYWYYYNGTNWVQGGVYQATTNADGSVTYNMLETALKNSFVADYNITDISKAAHTILKTNGTVIETSGSYCTYQFDVISGETYKLHIMYPTGSYSGDFNIAIALLQDTTLITSITTSDLTITNNYYDLILNIPSNVNKVIINTPLYESDIVSQNKSYIIKVHDYDVTNISKEQLDSKLQNIFEDYYSSVNLGTPFISNSYYSSDPSKFFSYSGTNVYSLNVNPGEKYRITASQVFANPLIAFAGNNYSYTETIGGNEYVIKGLIGYIKDNESNHQFTEYNFTIPEYCNTIYINTKASDTTLKLEKVNSYKLNISDILPNYNKVGFNHLYAIGDSLTEVNFRALHNYLYWIKNDIPDLTITNLGASGTGYMNGAGTGNTFTNRINSINTYDLNTDVVIVMGSINDMQYVADNLGQLGDTTTATIYGSLYTFFNTLFTEFNGVRVGCISPLNWKNSENSAALSSYLIALKETCELFNVPYLDIHQITNLRPNNDSFLTEYYTADGTGSSSEVDSGGVHPNSKGHHLFYSRIKEFINTL